MFSNTIQPKWVAIGIYHSDLNQLLKETATQFLSDALESGIIKKFFFSRSSNRGTNLLLVLKVNEADIQLLKTSVITKIESFLQFHPSVSEVDVSPVIDWFLPFPANHIEFKDNFLLDIMETGGLHASEVAEDVLSACSENIVKMTQSKPDWNSGSVVGLGIQMHTIFCYYFLNNQEELSEFYEFFFEDLLKLANSTDPDFRNKLLPGLQNSFEKQSQSIFNFIQYHLSSLEEGDLFDDELLDNWSTASKDSYAKLATICEKRLYFAPESFEYNPALKTSKKNQEKWPVIMYYLRSINNQIGIADIYEINLVYTLKQYATYVPV
jgi:hypothetical protein